MLCTAVEVCWRNLEARVSVTYTDIAGSRVFWNVSILLANYKTDIQYKTNLLSLISLWKRPQKTSVLAVSCLRRERHTEGSGSLVSEFNSLLSFPFFRASVLDKSCLLYERSSLISTTQTFYRWDFVQFFITSCLFKQYRIFYPSCSPFVPVFIFTKSLSFSFIFFSSFFPFWLSFHITFVSSLNLPCLLDLAFYFLFPFILPSLLFKQRVL